MDITKLTALLQSHGIDTKVFGTGKTKALSKLLDEINSGETELVEQDGQIFREINAVSIQVFFDHPTDGRLILKEDRQVFEDGRTRSRDYQDGNIVSVAEKMTPNEHWADAARRGVLEELGIDISQLVLTYVALVIKKRDSISYPGLHGIYHLNRVQVDLDTDMYNPDGYKEVQSDKTTYFVWQKWEEE